jgi:hypothetical protein
VQVTNPFVVDPRLSMFGGKNNMEMKHAIELEMEEHKHSSARVRNKRNIFGSIISSLTGLATGREALTPIKTMDLKIDF